VCLSSTTSASRFSVRRLKASTASSYASYQYILRRPVGGRESTDFHHSIDAPVKLVIVVQAKTFEESSFRLALSQCWTGRSHGSVRGLALLRGPEKYRVDNAKSNRDLG